MDFDFNQILDEIGNFGIYQIYLCAFMVVPSALICALIYFTQFFIILIPSHWCSIQSQNQSVLSLRNSYIPFELQNDNRVYSNCYMYDEPNVNQISDSLLNVSSHKCTNGWHYEYASLYPTMATESNWVCDRDRQPYNVQTIFYIGTSIGCLFFGYISDRYGRKPSIIGSSLVACIAGTATAFSYDFWSFAVLRFLVGTSIIPLSEDPYVLCLEYIGVEKRTLGIIAWTFGYITASIICPWIAYALQSWRLLCIVTSAPLFLIIISAKLIPESASWLMSRGNSDKALQLLTKVAKVNKRKMPVIPLNENLLNHLNQDISKNSDSLLTENAKNFSGFTIFQWPRLRKRSLILAICWFFLFTCYHTNTQNTSNLGSDIYTSFTFGALVEVPATLIVFLALDRIGRRSPMCVSMITAGVTGLSTLFITSGESSAKYFLLAALIMRVSLATEYNIIIQYSTEVYPTVLRGRSLAFLRFMGTLGLYLSPSIVYLALKNPSWPFAITGIMALIVAVCALFLPETMNQNLPHSLEEGENFGKNQHFFDFPCIQPSNQTVIE